MSYEILADYERFDEQHENTAEALRESDEWQVSKPDDDEQTFFISYTGPDGTDYTHTIHGQDTVEYVEELVLLGGGSDVTINQLS